jgi:hypothetical protein
MRQQAIVRREMKATVSIAAWLAARGALAALSFAAVMIQWLTAEGLSQPVRAERGHSMTV